MSGIVISLLLGTATPGEGSLAARLDQAKQSTAANIVAASPRVDLIHPGAQKYLREAGLLR